MGRIARAIDLPTMVGEDVAEPRRIKLVFSRLYTAITQAFQAVLDVINGQVEFSNFLHAEVTVSDTGSANTEFTVTHSLGFIPARYLVTKINKGGVVYDSGTTWTTEAIYLKCSAANAAVTVSVMR